MSTVIIFAGTTEGRMLSEELSGKQIPVAACVATEYGETLLTENRYLKVHAGRMDREQIAGFIQREGASLVVDATHPYAAVVSQNVSMACQDTKVPYIRLIRESEKVDFEHVVQVSSVEEAADYLAGTEGNILVTTGSKELAKYTAIPDCEKRVFARVLSTGEVAQACEKLGFRGRNLICMQGPFSEELNAAMLRQFDCRYLVTKETGKAGGFEEKIRAASKAGARVVLVGRPPEQEGYSYEEVMELLKERFWKNGEETQKDPEETAHDRQDAGAGKHIITLIGIGMGTRSGMTVEAAEAVKEADLLIGARRMLEAAGHANRPFYEDYDAKRIADYIRTHP